MATHTITSEQDWPALSAAGLDTVVDPMILRCGEFFLQGASGVANAGPAWHLLDKNVHAVGMFFDAVILHDRIPVFNYGDTYDMGLNFEERTLGAVNRDEHVLVDVDVHRGPYTQAKQEVLSQLEDLYTGPERIAPAVAKDCLEELAAAEYRWQPELGDLEAVLPTSDARTVARFLLGGMIFAAYAQMLEGQHLVQPKRSRLMLAVQLGAHSARHDFEDELFAELKARARGTAVKDLPWRPTFLPYLLTSSETPEAVLAAALVLRASSEVREYREWWRAALQRWDTHGEVESYKKDIAAIARHVDRLTGAASVMPKIEVKLTAADVVKTAMGQPAGPSVDLTPTLEGLWGWWFANLPGRRYRKLLARAVADDAEYAQLTNRLRTVWGQAPRRPH